MQGQLYKADRELLYNTIIEEKPDVVFEVGTWHGGGSTLSISKALAKNGKGKLYTIEMVKNFYDSAKAGYKKERPDLLPYIEFIYGESLVEFPKILQKLSKAKGSHRVADVIFLDGCGTKSLGGHTSTMAEIEMFEPYMSKDGVFMMHDWNDDKALLAKPYLKKSKKWKIVKELHRPESIGFGKAIFKL